MLQLCYFSLKLQPGFKVGRHAHKNRVVPSYQKKYTPVKDFDFTSAKGKKRKKDSALSVKHHLPYGND